MLIGSSVELKCKAGFFNTATSFSVKCENTESFKQFDKNKFPCSPITCPISDLALRQGVNEKVHAFVSPLRLGFARVIAAQMLCWVVVDMYTFYVHKILRRFKPRAHTLTLQPLSGHWLHRVAGNRFLVSASQ